VPVSAGRRDDALVGCRSFAPALDAIIEAAARCANIAAQSATATISLIPT
jgi:hypothetical protein